MGRRLDFHEILVELLGTRAVYFQPPEEKKMEYPCIVYQRDLATTQFADNSPYRTTKRYQVTYIDEDPDSLVPDKLAKLPLSTFARFFVADNLNHDVYNVYF
jgi:hypothetical protein